MKTLILISALFLSNSLLANTYKVNLHNIQNQHINISQYVPNSENESSNESPTVPVKSKSCLDILDNESSSASGIYLIYPDGSTEVSIFCDMTTDGGGWTLISKYNYGNRVCDYFNGNDCNITELTNTGTSKSAVLNKIFIKQLNTDSRFSELRSVGGGYDTLVRTADLSFVLEVGTNYYGKSLQCRNTNDSNWNSYSYTSATDLSLMLGISTWTQGTSYIGKNTSKICGNGILFGTSSTGRNSYQWINAGYTGYPTTSGVFYIR